MPYSPMELAEAFLKTGELDDAIEAIKTQLEAHPDDDHARRLYIQVLLRLLDPSEIAGLIHEFEFLSEKTVADWQLQSTVHERAGDIILAMDAIRQARKIAPDDARLAERLLDLSLKGGFYDSALELVREQDRTWQWLEREGDILVLLGDDMLATARYGLVLSHLDDFKDRLREDYLNALKTRVMLARAHAYRRLGHIDIAREHYETAQSILGDDVTIQFNLGLLVYLDGDTENALVLCRDALAKASGSLGDMMLSSLDGDKTWHHLKDQLTA